MDELINDMKVKGLVSFVTRGRSTAVSSFIKALATTVPVGADSDWLGYRLWEVRN